MFFVLLDNIRSLFNVGAIFRTADGAGVSKIFLTGITGKPPHREIHKVALGAEETVPWSYYKNPADLVKEFKKEKMPIFALEATENSVPFDAVDYPERLCLIVGNEYNGIGEELLHEADAVVHLPMRGKKVSLNVSVAFGIAAYEIMKSKK